jgi:xylulose-5-phosphate/fructose-6-phosphate phosphoketolase
MASAGDIPTQETLAAIVMLQDAFPDLKIRYINVVDLLRLQPQTDHPHGLSDRDFDLLFSVDKPVIFNFHGYPWLIHRLTYSRSNHANFHVHGYREQGNINTPLELAIENGIDRFTLAMDVIKYVPRLQRTGGSALAGFLNEQIACRNYAFKHGIDKPEQANWKWPHEVKKAA